MLLLYKVFYLSQKFPKFYFWFNLVAYETGLITTGLVMLFSRHAQPALLYLVSTILTMSQCPKISVTLLM